MLLSEEKKEIKEKVFKAMWEEIVLRHLLPTSQGTLTLEILHLSQVSGVPIEKLARFLMEEYLSADVKRILLREQQNELVKYLKTNLQDIESKKD